MTNPSAYLKGKTALITGSSKGIGREIAIALAAHNVNLILFSRSKEKLDELASSVGTSAKLVTYAVDVSNYPAVEKAVKLAVEAVGPIDILINNAGLALGAPSPFPSLRPQDIGQMLFTNIIGVSNMTYCVLNNGFGDTGKEPKRGTVLNVSSTTALEAPPFPGESLYHASKKWLEGFSDALRNELVGTDIRVLVVRPGVVDTEFHTRRVGYDETAHSEFMKGFEPLKPVDIAKAVVYMLAQPTGISVKALDVVPTAQRSLSVFDRDWNDRKDDRVD